MATRKKLNHDQNTREKIQTSQIINRLTDHVLGKLKNKEGEQITLEASQVTAALGLLKKVLPDLSATNVQGDIFNHHYVVSSEPLTEDEWTETYNTDLETAERAAESIN